MPIDSIGLAQQFMGGGGLGSTSANPVNLPLGGIGNLPPVASGRINTSRPRRGRHGHLADDENPIPIKPLGFPPGVPISETPVGPGFDPNAPQLPPGAAAPGAAWGNMTRQQRMDWARNRVMQMRGQVAGGQARQAAGGQTMPYGNDFREFVPPGAGGGQGSGLLPAGSQPWEGGAQGLGATPPGQPDPNTMYYPIVENGITSWVPVPPGSPLPATAKHRAQIPAGTNIRSPGQG